MSTEFYLWIDLRQSGAGRWTTIEERDQQPQSLHPLQAQSAVDAQAEAISLLDESFNEKAVRNAIIFKFALNVTAHYEKDKYKRQGEKEMAKKKAEVEQLQKRIEELKKEMGEGT